MRNMGDWGGCSCGQLTSCLSSMMLLYSSVHPSSSRLHYRQGGSRLCWSLLGSVVVVFIKRRLQQLKALLQGSPSVSAVPAVLVFADLTYLRLLLRSYMRTCNIRMYVAATPAPSALGGGGQDQGEGEGGGRGHIIEWEEMLSKQRCSSWAD